MSLPERYGGFPDLEGDSYGGRCRDLLPSAAAMASVSSYQEKQAAQKINPCVSAAVVAACSKEAAASAHRNPSSGTR